MPLPDRGTTSAISLGSLDGMVRLAECAPADIGLNIRVMLAEALGASVWPEILPVKMVNWPLFIVRVPMVRLAVPSFLTVTVCIVLLSPTSTSPKLIDAGSTEILGIMPLPDRATTDGLSLGLGSLDGMVKLADCGPVAAGLKTRDILAEAPGISVCREISPLEMVNWPLFIVRLPMVRLAVPSFLTVTLRSVLLSPTSTSPKLIDVGLTDISGLYGAVPMPVRVT